MPSNWTCGQAVFGDDWPAIAVLPKGKTNALTVDLGVPDDWTLQDAIDALDGGGRTRRRPFCERQLISSFIVQRMAVATFGVFLHCGQDIFPTRWTLEALGSSLKVRCQVIKRKFGVARPPFVQGPQLNS